MSEKPLSQIPIIHHGALNEQYDRTAVEQVLEHIEGQVSLDSYVKAQCSAPQVVERITELENCVWSLCTELRRYDSRNAELERAKLLLKNRLEVVQGTHTFHSQLGLEWEK